MSISSSSVKPTGVHLVGSIPLPSAEDVFTKTTSALPNRLLRLPDGETAYRQNFVVFQGETAFASIPQLLWKHDAQYNSVSMPLPTSEELSKLSATLHESPPFQTQYDEHGIESYKKFISLRSSGVIPSNTRFQVSLPSPLDTICLIADGYQATIEPFYEQALAAAVKKLENAIPHKDLAIQWDAATEFAMLEGAYWPHFKPFFDPVKEGVVDRLVRLANMVDPEVECGFHLCYGDMGHRHFVEPKDMACLVDVASAIMKGSNRDISWFHMPVPKGRTDQEYFAPLKTLELGDTALFLGLVHFDDLEGTKKRIESAAATGKAFGVATECGMGRTPPEHLDSILEISAAVTAPYSQGT